MRIAFYAPLKPPDHPVPSGDRRMANLLIQAMRHAGHEVELANRLRSRDARGDPERQARLERIGKTRADRLLRLYESRPAAARPELWFTYHLYYKAPDWLGPRVARGLGIPYVVAEASVAPKRQDGPWDAGHRATLAALAQAAAVIALNPADIDCLPAGTPVTLLKPFLDTAPFERAAAQRPRLRNGLAARFGLDPEWPWLVTVAMMRPGDKLASYRLLAETLGGLRDRPWHWVVVGDGPARQDVDTAIAPLIAEDPRRVRFIGEMPAEATPEITAACDLFVWPAVNEAYGMALLEAQAAGLPVIAGRVGGVPSIVRDGETGRLTAPGDGDAFAAALRQLLANPERRRAMASAAAASARSDHALETAARHLDAILSNAVAAVTGTSRRHTAPAPFESSASADDSPARPKA